MLQSPRASRDLGQRHGFDRYGGKYQPGTGSLYPGKDQINQAAEPKVLAGPPVLVKFHHLRPAVQVRGSPERRPALMIYLTGLDGGGEPIPVRQARRGNAASGERLEVMDLAGRHLQVYEPVGGSLDIGAVIETRRRRAMIDTMKEFSAWRGRKVSSKREAMW